MSNKPKARTVISEISVGTPLFDKYGKPFGYVVSVQIKGPHQRVDFDEKQVVYSPRPVLIDATLSVLPSHAILNFKDGREGGNSYILPQTEALQEFAEEK